MTDISKAEFLESLYAKLDDAIALELKMQASGDHRAQIEAQKLVHKWEKLVVNNGGALDV